MLDYLQLYPETLELIKRYPKADRYDLLEAQTLYACEGRQPDWPDDDTKWLIWEALKVQVDRANKKVEQNRANARQRKPSEARRSEPERNAANASEPERKPTNPINTNYELLTTKDIDDDDTTRVRETSFGHVEADPVIVAVQSELNGLTVSHYDDLDAFRKDLPDELILEAVNEAVAHGARTWAYVRSILQGYIKDSVKTVGEARDRAQRRKRSRDKPAGTNSYTQRHYTESDLEARITEL